MNTTAEDIFSTTSTSSTSVPYDSLASLDLGTSNTSSNAPVSGPTVGGVADASSLAILAASLKDVDSTTHALLANLLASAQKPVASLEKDDGTLAGDEQDLEALMKDMDNTYDALGELETRAEDILGKLDAFLRDNGFEGDIDLDEEEEEEEEEEEDAENAEMDGSTDEAAGSNSNGSTDLMDTTK
ncbi:hypothetical protein HDU79_008966 [Rhizoclosmatium sp. JEL0117]|nr:hypothetical protein HDU79_008966 [Rhizoclosmatium sp. JEL0117]